MAYRAFDEWPLVVGAAPAAGAVTAARPVRDGVREPAFGPIEASVVALAAHDHRWSIRPRTRFVRLVEALFGFRQSNRLADPRLEALRRFAVLARVTRGRPPQAEVEAFLAAGFPDRAVFALSSPSR